MLLKNSDDLYFLGFLKDFFRIEVKLVLLYVFVCLLCLEIEFMILYIKCLLGFFKFCVNI